MADTKRDLTGVPLEDLSAEEAAVASQELTAKISELIAEMQKSSFHRGELAREAGDIAGASGFKGHLARLLNEKADVREQRKQEDIGLSIREMKKMQAMMLHKSIVDFRSNPNKETEDEAKARYADLELKALRSLGDLYREGMIDRNAYAKLFGEIDEQSNRVYRGGAQNLDASREKIKEDAKAEQDAKVNSAIFNKVKDFGASVSNSRLGKAVGNFTKFAYPFYQKNRVSLGKIFSGQVGGKGAASALSGAAGMVGDPRAKAVLMAAGKIAEWAGEYNDDRAEKRQMGIAGGFGVGALGTEKAQQYEDIGESLNKGGGKAFASFAANVNNMLEQMRRGGDGGALAAANQRYGLVLNGSGEGGLAKDADEVIRSIISRVTAYQKAGNVQAVAGLMRTLGVDQKNMELFMHGQAAYDARVGRKAKMLDAESAQKLDETAMKSQESDFDAAKQKRIRNESWAGVGGAINRAWNGMTRVVNRAISNPMDGLDRDKTDENFFSEFQATKDNAAEREKVRGEYLKTHTPTAFGMVENSTLPDLYKDIGKPKKGVADGGGAPSLPVQDEALRIIPETIGGGTTIGSQDNSVSVKVDKVELHTTSSTLEGAGKDVGVGLQEGLENWSKPIVKNFGDGEL